MVSILSAFTHTRSQANFHLMWTPFVEPRIYIYTYIYVKTNLIVRKLDSTNNCCSFEWVCVACPKNGNHLQRSFTFSELNDAYAIHVLYSGIILTERNQERNKLTTFVIGKIKKRRRSTAWNVRTHLCRWLFLDDLLSCVHRPIDWLDFGGFVGTHVAHNRFNWSVANSDRLMWVLLKRRFFHSSHVPIDERHKNCILRKFIWLFARSTFIFHRAEDFDIGMLVCMRVRVQSI